MPRSVFVYSCVVHCHVTRLFLCADPYMYTVRYPLISRGIVASVRGGIVNLFPIQFVWNFVGDIKFKSGIVSRVA